MVKAVKRNAKEASNLFHNIMGASVKGNPKPKEKKKPNHYSLPIEEMGFPIRLQTILKKNGVNTLKDLASCELWDIMQFKNLGNKSISLIETALEKYKLRLGDFKS